ncbi:hypothetical protein ACROYT_G040634 [Oculina patagonica]
MILKDTAVCPAFARNNRTLKWWHWTSRASGLDRRIEDRGTGRIESGGEINLMGLGTNLMVNTNEDFPPDIGTGAAFPLPPVALTPLPAQVAFGDSLHQNPLPNTQIDFSEVVRQREISEQHRLAYSWNKIANYVATEIQQLHTCLHSNWDTLSARKMVESVTLAWKSFEEIHTSYMAFSKTLLTANKASQFDKFVEQQIERMPQMSGPLREVVRNILDEPIPLEVQKRLLKPLLAQKYHPKPPQRLCHKEKKEQKRKNIQNEFDPFVPHENWVVTNYQNEILNLLDVAEDEGEENSGRRFIRWRFIRGLEKDLTPNFLEKIRENVNTAFYIRHVYSYQLRNIDDDTVIVYYINKGSPWIHKLSAAEKWLTEQETKRLAPDNIKRPSTKWKFESFFNVDVKVVLDRQPLLGTGPLPDWLRNLAHGRSMVALDTYLDNLCLWRCIAVHQGARIDRSTAAARGLAKSFFKLETVPTDCPKTSLDELDEVERHLNQGAAFSDWLGIRVYEPVREENEEVVWHLRRNSPAMLTNILTIGIYEGHAFVIKDIERLAKTYACAHCNARFTKVCNLKRHYQTCSQGKTIIDCPDKKVEEPQTSFEKAFYPSNQASKESLRWLEREAKRRKIHIHHAMCGHGGERWVERAPVDGYDPISKTVFQYHGCHWHGCRKCYPQDRNKIIVRNDQTREDRFKATMKRTGWLRLRGYRVVEAWACEVRKSFVDTPRAQTKSYPHAILYDFEAYGDNNQRKEPTPTLTIENAHVPISVSIGDTLEREPTHICERDPAELVRKFMEELERRGKNIRVQVRAKFMPKDVGLLPKAQRQKIEEWCNQVPVVGFNSGSYDLNLIKNNFADRLADTTGKVRVAKNCNKIMFLLTQGFRFLDIINYLGPGTSYEKWVKAYGCEATKSWFPYEWFDSPEKLDYPGLPDYLAWYSRLKNSFVLKLSEWRACKKLFREKGMRTFADWLRYYNNLDVMPGLEALQKMKAFYTEKGIDIFKDAVSIPGVSLHYLLRGAVERGAEMYSPGEQAYEMLKGAVVGGPSIVFTRYHEAGVTKIRDHQFENANFCKNIVGYDANALYLSTMLEDMPCGKEQLWYHTGMEKCAAYYLMRNLKGENPFLYIPAGWFGFAEVDIEIPQKLWKKFEEMPPFFYNKEVPDEAVPQHMHEYLKKTSRNRGDGKKLVGALSAKKILLYAPLLRWYVEHGAVITAVHRTIDYQPKKIFPWFVEQVTEARRTGDVDKSKALLADVFKLLGNSAYGKLIEALERQTNVIYTKDEKVVDRALRSAYFSDLDEIGQAYELESRKPRITISRPFQVGIAVYQLAKLRMLKFYYDFLDKYFERKDFELIQMDTDSCYMAISASKLEDIVKPELKQEFEAQKKQWLAWDKWSGRTPGLFKLECTGSRMIALCSKCYFIEEPEGEKKKFSTKGMSKTQNEIRWQGFKAALNGHKDMATNRGFRMKEGKMVTYEQEKLGLSAYYDKRWVLEDGIHTEPIEYHV